MHSSSCLRLQGFRKAIAAAKLSQVAQPPELERNAPLVSVAELVVYPRGEGMGFFAAWKSRNKRSNFGAECR
jgi:hypothetical protein